LATLLTLVAVGAACGPSTTASAAPAPPRVLFVDHFAGPDGLVTNEYAHWNWTHRDAVISPAWDMTSGSLLRHHGDAWTGVPDATTPDARSLLHTDSAVFRVTTRRADFGDVTVSMRLRNIRLTSTPRTPRTDWDGVHLFLRYQSEQYLYYASVNRRDGTVAIKKKVPGGPSNGGTYYTLATGRNPVAYGAWQSVQARVVNNRDGSVTIALWDNGRLLTTATDRGVHGVPIRQAGRVGVRADNAEVELDDFTVTAG
jgi:hypothetical protein